MQGRLTGRRWGFSSTDDTMKQRGIAMKIRLQLIPAVLVFSAAAFAQPSQTSLKVGAAKVDVTPAQNELPQNSLGILDHIYVRAIVIDNGKTRAALVEVPGNPPRDYETVAKRAEAELGIPVKQNLAGGTHSHSIGRVPRISEKIFEALKAANSKLQPAHMGYGTGVSYINANRNM